MTARDLVTSRMAKQARHFPDLDLTPVDTADLEPRDAALARAIEHAVLRRWLTLVAVIDSRLTQSWDQLQPQVQAPLLVGAAQLLLMERLPDHAVIHEAVQWTKRHARAKAGGLVNAVLRRLSELRGEIVERFDPQRADELPLQDGRAWRLKDTVFDDVPIVRLAQQTSHPAELIRHWIDTLGPDDAGRLARHSVMHAPIILTDLEEDAAENPLLTPHEQSGFFVFSGPHDALTRLLAESHRSRVQDPTAAEPGAATRQMNPKVIIDYCAGVGTKSSQLLALHPNARLIITDRNSRRLEVLRQVFSDRDRVEVVDFERIREHDGRADVLVLDVPCSNSGVLARRVEAKYRLSARSLEQLTEIQRQIVADSLPLLSEGGRLLYSTCSIEAAENQQMTQWISQWHPLQVISALSRQPRGEPGEPMAEYRDGGYFALFESAR